MALRINGELVDSEAIREEERMVRGRLAEANLDNDPLAAERRVREWARENLVERTVLRQEARKDPEPVPPEDLDRMFHEVRDQSPSQSGCILPGSDAQVREELEVRFRIDRLLARVTARVSPPKHKDVADYYVKHRDEFQSEESIHAAHIVKNLGEGVSEEEAQAAIGQVEAELKAGADFSELADRMSDCPGRGGDLGYFQRGQMVEEFDRVVFDMKPGEVSGVFRTVFGFHIAKVIERRPAGPLGLQEVKDQIASMLLETKRQKVVEQYLDRLMAAASIEEVP
jgi:parvulin-like peptidyl-prolyl isomerase